MKTTKDLSVIFVWRIGGTLIDIIRLGNLQNLVDWHQFLEAE
ncbi:MAG: hypothetical protein ACRD9Y_20385 [Blastocatellia bacterium]